MDEIMAGGIKAVLAGVSMMLDQIELDDLEAYVKEIDSQVNRFEAFGHITHPTEYRKAIHGDKEYQSIKLQLDAAKHLLQVRRKIKELHDLGLKE